MKKKDEKKSVETKQLNSTMSVGITNNSKMFGILWIAQLAEQRWKKSSKWAFWFGPMLVINLNHAAKNLSCRLIPNALKCIFFIYLRAVVSLNVLRPFQFKIIKRKTKKQKSSERIRKQYILKMHTIKSWTKKDSKRDISFENRNTEIMMMRKREDKKRNT